MPMFVVVDPDSGVTVGPFMSSDDANEYFTELATSEGWTDVLELVKKTGKAFQEKGDPFVFVSGRAELLQLVEVEPPVQYASEIRGIEHAERKPGPDELHRWTPKTGSVSKCAVCGRGRSYGNHTNI